MAGRPVWGVQWAAVAAIACAALAVHSARLLPAFHPSWGAHLSDLRTVLTHMHLGSWEQWGQWGPPAPPAVPQPPPQAPAQPPPTSLALPASANDSHPQDEWGTSPPGGTHRDLRNHLWLLHDVLKCVAFACAVCGYWMRQGLPSAFSTSTPSSTSVAGRERTGTTLTHNGAAVRRRSSKLQEARGVSLDPVAVPLATSSSDGCDASPGPTTAPAKSRPRAGMGEGHGKPAVWDSKRQPSLGTLYREEKKTELDSLSAEDSMLFWWLESCLSTLWPRVHDMRGRTALGLVLLCRLLPLTLLAVLDLERETGLSVAKRVIQLWTAAAGLFVGGIYFDSETVSRTGVARGAGGAPGSPRSDLSGRGEDREFALWRRLRSCSANVTITDPQGLKAWSKLHSCLLFFFCGMEVQAAKALGTMRTARHTERYNEPSAILLVTGVWREQLLLPFELLSWAVFRHALIGPVAVFAAVLFAGHRLGLPAARWMLASLSGALFGIIQGLSAWFVLGAMRRVGLGTLAIVVCVELSRLELDLKLFQAPTTLMAMSVQKRTATYLEQCRRVADLHLRIRWPIHFLILNFFVVLVLDGCDDQSCISSACSPGEDCCLSINCAYLLDWAKYVGHHGISFAYVFMVLWRMSSLNHALFERMLDSVHAARFLNLAGERCSGDILRFAAADDDLPAQPEPGLTPPWSPVAARRFTDPTPAEGDQCAGEADPQSAGEAPSTPPPVPAATTTTTNRAARPRGRAGDGGGVAALERAEVIEHHETVAWGNLINSPRHRQTAGVLFCGYSVGRMQLVSFVGAWLLGLVSENGHIILNMFPFLAVFDRLWVW